MSKQRLLAIALVSVLIALAGVAWLATRPRAIERGAEATPEASSPRPPPRPDPAASRVESAGAPSAAAPAAADERREVELDAANAVRVTIAPPAGTPADESIGLIAASFLAREGESPQDLAGAIERYRMRQRDAFAAAFRSAGVAASESASDAVAEVECERAADGSFLARFEPGAVKGALRLRSRYAYLDEDTLVFDLPTGEISLAPSLGAWFTGRFEPPPGLPDEIDPARIGRFQAQLFGWSFGAGSSRNVQLAREVGQDLAFEIGGVRPGYRYFFSADPGVLVPVSETELEFEAGAHVDRAFPLELGARVEGTVVDAGGAGVARALVRVQSDGARWGSGGRNATTGENGSFLVRGIVPGELSVRAERDGYVAASVERLRASDGAVLGDLVLRLGRGATLRGRVAWPDGSPAAGAEVSTSESEKGESRNESRWRTSTTHADTADADGRFERSGLSGALFTVRAQAEREERTWTAIAQDVGASAEVVLVLAEPHDVHGRVVDDRGEPIRAFSIACNRADVAFGDTEFANESRSFSERADGRFSVDLASGAWTLSASSPDHAESEAVRVEAPQSGAELVLVAPRCASVSGIVVDPSGAPLAGATVSASNDAGAPRWRGDDKVSTSDVEGRFTIGAVAPGGATLRASAEGYAPSAPFDVALAAGEARAGVELALRIGGRLEGEIYASSGAPDPGRRIMVGNFAEMGLSGGNATSDAAGRFTVEHLAAGNYQVVAEPRAEDLRNRGRENPAELFASLKMQSVEIRDGETTHVVLGAPPKAPVRLHGRVTRRGQPVASGVVMAIREGAPVLDSMKLAQVGGDGRYEVTLNEPGDWVLTVGKEMGDDEAVEFHETIPEAPEHELDLALPNGAIRGRVVGGGGEALEGVTVALEREGEVSLFSIADGRTASSDGDGRFEFASLAPGRYRLRAPHARGGPFGGGRLERGVAVRSGISLGADAVVDGIELTLTAPCTIAGVVRNADGDPAPRAAVFVRAHDGELLNPVSACASDASGRFEFTGAAPGAYTVSARSGTLASRESAPVQAVEGVPAEVELKLEPGTLLRVTIEDGEGRRVRASVRVLDEGGRDLGGLYGRDALERVLTEGMSSTERRVGPLPAGKYRVVATGPDGESVTKPVTLSGQEERSLKIKLKE